MKLFNDYALENIKTKIKSDTVIALDGGDISHIYGKNFEKQCKVRDGSSKKIETGYWLNQISCYMDKITMSIPVLLDIYSHEEENFKSGNLSRILCLKKFYNSSMLHFYYPFLLKI